MRIGWFTKPRLMYVMIGLAVVIASTTTLVVVPDLLKKSSPASQDQSEGTSQPTDETSVTGSAKVTDLQCSFLETSQWVGGHTNYFEITAIGTANGPQGAAFSVDTNPTLTGTGEGRQIDCGSWAQFTKTSDYWFDCIRSGDSETTTWRGVFKYQDVYYDDQPRSESFPYSVSIGLHLDKNDYYGQDFVHDSKSTTCSK